MVKGKLVLKFWIIICLFIVIFIWFFHITPSSKVELENAIDAYRMETYSGIVINKLIDRNEHNFKKIFLNENGRKRVILFDIETGGIFNYLLIGDSIIKTKGDLEVIVIRNNKDTLINLEFEGL